MEIEIVINREGKCKAEAIYYGDKVVVKKGSKINMKPLQSARGRLIKKYRIDKMIVDENGILLSDCEFPSVSYAARFVTGRSENGFIAWKTVENISLDEWLSKKGLRNKKIRNKQNGEV